MPFDVDSLDTDAREYVDGLLSQVAALTVDDPPGLPEDLDPVVKARLDEQTEAIAKAESETARVAKQLADFEDAQATKTWEERAAALQVLLGDPEEVAPVLKALASADAVNFAKLDGMFDTLVAKKSLASLFNELGTTSDGGTALDKHAAHVAKIREDDSTVSLADAKKQAWKDHPDLVTANREGG